MPRGGIDIGSRAIKLVVIARGLVVRRAVEDTGSDPLAACRRLLDGGGDGSLTATGYGRHLFKEHWPDAEVVSEIKAVAVGAGHLVPGCRTLVDIGGQDTKAVALDGGVSVEAPVVFTGGCAQNPILVSLVAEALRLPVQVPESPQTVAALGCALLGAERSLANAD